MHCIQYPLPESPLYWSFDRTGKSRIAEQDWEKFDIPKLDLVTWIGSYWLGYEYDIAQDLLSSRGNNLDGRQYAREHGHPELIRGE